MSAPILTVADLRSLAGLSRAAADTHPDPALCRLVAACYDRLADGEELPAALREHLFTHLPAGFVPAALC